MFDYSVVVRSRQMPDRTVITVGGAPLGNQMEILLHKDLTHPSLTKFIGASWLDGRLILLEELVPGGTLADFLTKPPFALTWEHCLLKLATDVAKGMAYLHGSRYVCACVYILRKLSLSVWAFFFLSVVLMRLAFYIASDTMMSKRGPTNHALSIETSNHRTF